MKTSLKSLLIISITCLLILPLLNCKKKNAGSGTPITFAFWGSAEEIEIIEKTVKPWDEKREDLHVVFQHVPTGGGQTANYVQRILTQMAGGTAPDVVFMEVNIFVDFCYRNMLVDLAPFIKKDKEFKIKDFYHDVVKRFTKDGKIYVIPRDTAPFNCVYYNKDLFNKERLDYPKNNWTWDDLINIGKKLTKRNNQNVVQQYGFYAWPLMNFVYSAGGGFVDNVNDPVKCILDTPNSRRGLKFVYDMMWIHEISPKPASMDLGGVEMFEAGKLAMYGSGIWETPALRKLKAFDWDIVPFPKAKNMPLKTGTGGSGYAIVKTSKHPDKAWDLIKCLAGDYGQSILADTGLAQPAKTKIADSKHFAYDGKKPKNKAILLNAVKNVVYEPFHPRWNEIYKKYIGPEFDLYFHNKQTLDESINKIIPKVNEALKEKL